VSDEIVSDETGRTNSRSALITAALEEFDEKGYEAATVAGIADRAGVTTGALYAHFRGKLDLLFRTVGMKSVDDLVRDAEAVAVAGRSGSASVQIGQNLARPVHRESLLLLDVMVLARRDARLGGTIRRLVASKIDALAKMTEAGRASGVVSTDLSSNDISRLLVLLSLGKLAMAAVGEQPPSEAAFIDIAEAVLPSDPGGPTRRSALDSVAASAAKAQRARADFEARVVSAAEQGHSLRQIGDAAGVSHEQIRRVVSDAKRSSATEGGAAR
jgi:AcrR family transcriptional regulator